MTRTAKRSTRLREPVSGVKPVRAAIYTRKSVADGLDQEFNSLDAQRQSAESYVLSMQGERWAALPDRYDDGGFSGANTDRPAFRRLMADVEAGKIDVVVVYRLDRLSRSLLDFAQLMLVFEQHGVAFVSVTERFDTSTPMGRMVLNLLATFAQFERETIALRTRDKIQATRKRGTWTGGRPVLGFDIVDKKLVVNEREAEQVRRIFGLYLDLGGVVAVTQELVLLGIPNKRWTTAKGTEQGGGAFDKNSVNALLKNPLYVGDLRAGDAVVNGEHKAIVDRGAWDAVQARLAAQAPSLGAASPKRGQGAKRSPALLSGIARCKCGAAMTPTHSTRGTKRYAYYTCARSVKQGKAACPGSRVAAGILEQFVVDRVREVGRDPAVIDAALAVDRDERGAERERLNVEERAIGEGRSRHVADRRRLLAAVGGRDAPAGLLERVRELDGLVAEADARLPRLAADAAALDAEADAEGLRAALAEFDSLWGTLDAAEQARLLALVLDEVTVHSSEGEAELRFRGGR